MHADWLAIVDEDLLEEHPRYLARLDISVRHEESLGAVRTRPAQTEAFLVCRSGLDEHEPRARNFRFYSATKSLAYDKTSAGAR